MTNVSSSTRRRKLGLRGAQSHPPAAAQSRRVPCLTFPGLVRNHSFEI